MSRARCRDPVEHPVGRNGFGPGRQRVSMSCILVDFNLRRFRGPRLVTGTVLLRFKSARVRSQQSWRGIVTPGEGTDRRMAGWVRRL
jgi:hypothetical protein